MPDAIRLSFLDWLSNEDGERQAQYTAFREYYDGDHDTQLTARQRAYLQIKMGEEFNSNYCPIVVDALSERLSVTGVQADSGQDEVFWDWWTANRMDGTQGVVHLSGVRDGDTYVMVEWDNEEARPRFTPELAFDGIYGVKVHYSQDGPREIAFASKRWRVESEDPDKAGKLRRLNLYYPDRIEKYYSDAEAYEGAWQPYQEEDGGPWPLAWVDKSGVPLGVPVVHFRNKDQGYHYGVSEIKNVVPLQNALNKTLIDLLATADGAGFPLFYMLGDDPSGLTTAPGSWVYSLRAPGGEDGVAVGKIAAEDCRPLIALKDSMVSEIARVSRTPLSYFQVSGQVAAEGTQKQQESGLVAKAKERQVTFGNAWEDALRLGRRLFNTFGPGGMAEDVSLSVQWADPQTRNELENAQELEIKSRLGVPQEQLWRELGYDTDQIAEMKAMKMEERSQNETIGAGLLEAFERGVPQEVPPERQGIEQ